MVAKKKTTKKKAIEKPIKTEIKVEPIEIAEMKLKIVGDTPLLMQRMSEETRQQLVAMVTGQGREKKKERDLMKEVEGKIHRDEKGNVCFPNEGFKKSMVEVAPYIDGLDKKKCRGSFFIMENLVPIKFKKQIVNKAVARDSGINRAPREVWRPEFKDWSCVLTIRYNSQQISAQEIVNLAKLAGFHIGLGSWSPQKGGNHGMYHPA